MSFAVGTQSFVIGLAVLMMTGLGPSTASAQVTEESEAEVAPVSAEGVYEDDIDESNIEVIKVDGGEAEGEDDLKYGDSVAAFGADDLEALGAQSIADLASFTPNLEIVTTGATTPTFFIRGVGLNVFSTNSSGAVAVYFNEVPKNSPAIQLGTIFDIETVNVLLGPQGSGNYRGASAGAIKTYTKKPKGVYNSYLRQTYGNYNAVDLEGAVGGPIFEEFLSGRLAFRFSDRDGYVKNGCGDSPRVEDRGVRPETGEIKGTDPRWSVCGDNVPYLTEPINDGRGNQYDGKSLVPEGLATKINRQHNWAARGTLLFQPTLDQEWLFTASGGKRDEDARQGQSIGSNQPARSVIGPFGRSFDNVLGGRDGSAYIAPEIERQRWKLDPCLNESDGSRFDAAGEYLCALPGGGPNAARVSYSSDVARTILARDLARNLDSDPYRGDYNAPGKTKLDTWAVSLQGDIVDDESISIRTVTGFDQYDRRLSLDLDQSPNTVAETDTSDHGWQVAQTLEFSGPATEILPIEWRFGGLFLYEELDVTSGGTFSGAQTFIGASSRQYKQKLWSGGAFGEVTLHLTDNLTVDMGARYNWERKSLNYLLTIARTADFELFRRETWHAPTGTVRATYNFSATSYAYWKYTRGWKGGHFNATVGVKGVFAAKPESIDSFEFGGHASWFSQKLTLDYSIFHYNYKDYQLNTVEQNFRTGPQFVVDNANSSEVYGTELTAGLRPVPGMLLIARFAWLQSQFLDYTQTHQESVQLNGFRSVIVNNDIRLAGEPLLSSPKYKVSMTAQQTVPIGRLGTLTARWDGAWSADIAYDATQTRGVPNSNGEQYLPKHSIGQRAYWTHNLRLAYRTPNGAIEVSGWVRNLTDVVVKSYAFDATAFNGTTIFFLGEPRMYGVSLSTTF